jgi:hypothetical protein
MERSLMGQRGQRQTLAAFNRLFSEAIARAGLRLAKAVKAARLSLTAIFFETEGSLPEMIF